MSFGLIVFVRGMLVGLEPIQSSSNERSLLCPGCSSQASCCSTTNCYYDIPPIIKWGFCGTYKCCFEITVLGYCLIVFLAVLVLIFLGGCLYRVFCGPINCNCRKVDVSEE